MSLDKIEMDKDDFNSWLKDMWELYDEAKKTLDEMSYMLSQLIEETHLFPPTNPYLSAPEISSQIHLTLENSRIKRLVGSEKRNPANPFLLMNSRVWILP